MEYILYAALIAIFGVVCLVVVTNLLASTKAQPALPALAEKNDSGITNLDPSTKAQLDQLFKPQGMDLDALVRELLTFSIKVPNSSSVAVSYLQSVRERAKLNGYNKVAKALEERTATVARIVSNAVTIQEKYVRLAEVFIEAQLMPQIREQELLIKLEKLQRELQDLKAGKVSPAIETIAQPLGDEFVSFGFVKN
jgi:hypothetical protein